MYKPLWEQKEMYRIQQTLNHVAVIRVEMLILPPNNPFSFQNIKMTVKTLTVKGWEKVKL